MKNLTITVDENVARWARIWAARRGASVSRLVGELLAEKMHSGRQYARAMRSWLRRRPVALKSASKSYARRDELYDR